MGGSLVQPEGSRGSPNPQLWLLDLAPLKSQHRAALFGTTQWCVSQFVSSAAFAKGFFFLFGSFLQRLVYGRQDLTDSWHPSHPQQMTW